MSEKITIRKARTHNLKNIDVDIPLYRITCLCGPSGSGKTSLAFHTLLTESKRRFINSFPTDVKFFWDIPHKVDVDEIYPVLPVWGLPQNNPVVGSRPTVLDLMGGFEDLARIFFYEGSLLCPEHEITLTKLSSIEIVERLGVEEKLEEGDVVHFLVNSSEYKRLIGEDFFPTRSYDEKEKVRPFQDFDPLWEIFRVKWGKLKKIQKKLEEFPKEIQESFYLFIKKNEKLKLVESKGVEECRICGYASDVSIDSEYHLSPYNALGACGACSGYGMNLVYDPKKLVKDKRLSLKEGAVSLLKYKRFEHLYPNMLKQARSLGIKTTIPFKDLDESIWKFLYEGHGDYPGFDSLFKHLESKRYKSMVRIFIRSLQTEQICSKCEGSRLEVHAHKRSLVNQDEFIQLGDFCLLSISEALEELDQWSEKQTFGEFSRLSKKRLKSKLSIAQELGLGHVGLSRRVKTLSAGEYQRILLNKFLSYEGSGSLFVLDEPSLGLGVEEQKILMKYIKALRDQKNTILIVDHSSYMQKASDEVIQMGPEAGEKGGEIVYQGKYKSLDHDELKLHRPEIQAPNELEFSVKVRDFDEIDVFLPTQGILWIDGRSGSGKTSCMVEGIGNKISEIIGGSPLLDQSHWCRLEHGEVKFKKAILINGQAMKTSSRSTVGTYLGVSPYLRKHYTDLPVSKSLGLEKGHFSSNSELGKCQTCEGRGVQTVEMSFMEDVEFTCDDCKGMKLKPMYAQIHDGVRTFHEAITSPVELVFDQIELTPKLRRLRDLFKKLNLEYLCLDRSLSSLSGGEKQRLKLLSELQSGIEDSILFFENLSFGLSNKELNSLCDLLSSLAHKNNLLVLIDQHEYFEKIANFSMTFEHPAQSPDRYLYS